MYLHNDLALSLMHLSGLIHLLSSSRLPAASKFMIDTGAGVIDADYRGTVHVLLFNLSDKDYEGQCNERSLDHSVLLLQATDRRASVLPSDSGRRRPRSPADLGADRDA